jgi:integrase
MAVPVDLQQLVGKRELQRSLNTKDIRTASVRKLAVLAEWHEHFDRLRRRRDMTEADFAVATWENYVETIHRDELERSRPPLIDAEAGELTSASREIRQIYLKTLSAHLSKGETVLVQWAADAFIERNQLLVERGSQQYRMLCLRLMRAQVEAMQRADERDAGDWAGMPRDPIVVRPASTAEVAKPGEQIGELFEVYAKENPKAISQATLAQARRDVGTFIALKGSDFPVSGIEKKVVREWKALLQRYPIKATECAIFKGMSFQEIIEANERLEQPKPLISPKTVNRYMAGFGAFCNWLAAHDYIAANPFIEMYLRVDKTKSNAGVFSSEQLHTLFASPLFTGCRDDRKWHVAGSHLIRDHRYWLPYVMMYSGARPGEIAQLLVDDVRQMHGVWVMHITDEGDPEKRVKTRGSFRVVPIHSELIRMGFVDHVERQRAAGERRVFPEAERNSTGQIAARFEKKFGTYLTKLGLKDGRGLSLYSFRHGFADALRTAGYMDAEIGIVMGHGEFSMTSRYGQLPQGTLAKRVELIEAASY